MSELEDILARDANAVVVAALSAAAAAAVAKLANGASNEEALFAAEEALADARAKAKFSNFEPG